jgi:hypothetical protein
LTVKSYRDFLPGRGFTPEMNRRIALQDRVIGNHAGKPQLSVQWSTYKPEHEGEEGQLHTFRAPDK